MTQKASEIMKIKEKEDTTKTEELEEKPSSDFELLLRLKAEYANYVKRMEKEKQDVEKLANSRIVKELVDLSECVSKALETAHEEKNVVSGLNAIKEKLNDIMEKEGVETITPKKGDEFDEKIHFAKAAIKSNEESAGRIFEVVRKGFKIKGIIVEPALVVISEK